MRAARETQPPPSLSRSDGEPAQAPPATGVRRRAAGSQRRTHRGTTVGAGSQVVQDTIGSTLDGADLLGHGVRRCLG